MAFFAQVSKSCEQINVRNISENFFGGVGRMTEVKWRATYGGLEVENRQLKAEKSVRKI